MSYAELQQYLVDKYGDNVKIINKSVTNLYHEAQFDTKVAEYIGVMKSLLIDDNVLYERAIRHYDLDNLNIYLVNKCISSIEGGIDVIYESGLLWANCGDGTYAILIDNYKFKWEKCRKGA